MKMIATFILLLIIPFQMLSQKNEFDKGKIYRQAKITKDQNGARYSTVIRVGFKKQNLDLPREVNDVQITNFINQEVRDVFKLINQKYGEIKIVKSFPNSSPNDTVTFSKILKKNVKLIDLSQRITLIFSSPVPIDTIITFLTKQKFINYAIGPWEFQLTAEPNDEFFQRSRWAFDKTELTKGWDITKSNSNINIAIVDVFDSTVTTLHPDLQNKVSLPDYWTSEFGGHGLFVSGLAGALTNNSTGIASSGWNSRVFFEKGWRKDHLSWGPPVAINNARSRGAHIINCSFPGGDDTDLYDAVHNAISYGVIVVASSGNVEPIVPSVQYPAAYNFGSGGQVIAITASICYDGINESKVANYNYSPGTNPVTDPTNSFIDFAAPGGNYTILHPTTYNSYIDNVSPGTSLAAPFACGIIALLKSLKNDLNSVQVYDILKNSADKIGTDPYPYDGGKWNQYLGYGRINAYKAIKYALEHYGGTLTQSLTIPSGETWNFQPGVTVSFASGTYLKVNGTLNAIGTSSNPITFNRSGSSGTWGGIQFNSGSSGNLQFCTIQYGEYGIYCYNSSPGISYCRLENNLNAGVNLFYYSNSSLYYNTIQNNYTGIVCGDHSSPNMLYPGHNVIRSNGAAGVAASYYSNPQIGSSSGYGNNSIYNNSSSISAHIYCTIDAQNNYWGGGNPVVYTSGNSVVNYLPILTTDPNSGRANIAPTEISQNDVTISYSMQGGDELSAALDKLKDKKYDEAIPLFLEVFKNNKEALLGKYALCKIEECFTQSGKKDYLSYSNKEIKPQLKEGSESYVVALELETHQMVNAGLYKDAVNNLQTILKKYNLNGETEKHILFTLGAHYSLFFGDKDNAEKYFQELKEKYPKDDLVKQINIIKGLGVVSNGTNQGGQINLPNNENLLITKSTISENAISNYPNPFNPTTKISFSLPQKGNVKLSVFDLLGREIKILADGVYEAGKHEVSFDARNLPSGVYFYNLTTGSNSISKKMLLVK